jgi:transcriptional regulator with XRE-family HTH domain
MRTKEQLLGKPNYLLTKYQQEIFRQVKTYMDENKLTQKDFARKLGELSGKPEGVSESYVSQILNGHFNFTLKKLIELGIVIGKIPVMQFEDADNYWMSKAEKLEEKELKLRNLEKKLKEREEFLKNRENGNSSYALAG